MCDLSEDMKKRIKKLETIIIALDTAFDNGDECINPFTDEIVLDNEYDSIKEELFKLSPNSNIFKTVTSSTAERSGKIVLHNPPMTSINKCNGTEEEKQKTIHKWFEDCRKYDYDLSAQKYYPSWLSSFFVMSFKHDGLALSVEYENGILKRAGLRSKSGRDGIDVTEKTRHIEGIPQQLSSPVTCVVRGEVETTKSEFQRQCDLLGEKAKANPRAHTAGSMGQKTADQMKDRGLRFTAYNILNLKEPPYTTEIEKAEWAERVLNLNFVKTVPFSLEKLKTFESNHRRLDFNVDGVVVSVNNLKLQEDMGRNGDKDTGNPRGKIAWKFKDEIKSTIVNDIIWQTGRTGNVTPVLVIDPIQLEGTTVSKCTAHNLGIIKTKKIGIGSRVEIIKSGKIIPKLHRVIESNGSLNIPCICPSCGGHLSEESGSDETLSLVCNNDECPASNTKNLYHYLKTLGCKGIAESTINKMSEAGILSKRSDFYKLTLDILTSNGITDRTAVLILSRIWMIPSPEQEKDNSILKNKLKNISSITVPVEKFFASFGIEGAGKEVGRGLSKKCNDFNSISNLTTSDLENIDGIGSITAKSVVDFLTKNKDEINEILKYVKIEISPEKDGKLKNKKFVLSGSMGMGKDYWKKQIENEGGEVKGSVSKKTDYLVAGEGSGLKSEKAEQLGIAVISEEELESLIKR